jgi:hypothetical protein
MSDNAVKQRNEETCQCKRMKKEALCQSHPGIAVLQQSWGTDILTDMSKNTKTGYNWKTKHL